MKKTSYPKEQDCSVRSFWFLCLILHLSHCVHCHSVTITMPPAYLLVLFPLSLFFFILKTNSNSVTPLLNKF